MSIEKVKEYFKSVGQDHRVMELTSSSATVELAARALNTAPARIAKTLSFKRPDGGALLIVAAGDARIENRKFKALFHTKAVMLTPQEAADLVGHAVGGVCPFAVNEGVDIYLDISLKRFETIFPACGSSNSAIELTPEELELYTNNQGWVDVCKNWQDTQI
ncbi:MAG: YbaK/EbsC family protein, partial [Proteobacteria bacterium]|nr:YbaK/EbsC family protein [Candidatus Avisuccinivibrio stercorigallinarum]